MGSLCHKALQIISELCLGGQVELEKCSGIFPLETTNQGIADTGRVKPPLPPRRLPRCLASAPRPAPPRPASPGGREAAPARDAWGAKALPPATHGSRRSPLEWAAAKLNFSRSPLSPELRRGRVGAGAEASALPRRPLLGFALWGTKLAGA